MEATRLKGVVVSDFRQVLLDLVGEGPMKAALAELTPADRRELDEAIGVSWVRISVLEQLLHSAAGHARRDVVTLNREINRITAERAVKTLLRLVLKLASPATVIERAATTYARAYDRGTVNVRKEMDGRTIVEVRGRPGMSGLAREAFGIAVESMMKHTGVTNVRVISAAHPEGADYTVTWR